jgi:phytoene dehydrogenase-like protein
MTATLAPLYCVVRLLLLLLPHLPRAATAAAYAFRGAPARTPAARATRARRAPAPAAAGALLPIAVPARGWPRRGKSTARSSDDDDLSRVPAAKVDPQRFEGASSAAKTLRRLLDEAVLLYCRLDSIGGGGLHPSSEGEWWLKDQLLSLLDYLAACLALAPREEEEEDGALADPGQIAAEIDRRLLRLYRGDNGAGDDPGARLSVEELAQLYGRARRWRSRQESLTRELIAVQRQLAAWRELIGSLPASTVPPPPPPSPPSSPGASPPPTRASSTALYAARSAGSEADAEELLEGEAFADLDDEDEEDDGDEEDEVVDVAIVGSGIAGLCAGAVLNALYGKKVGVYESHSLPGGCAHAFDRRAPSGLGFRFDSGPTVLLGCSGARPPMNALRQILDAVGQSVEWVPYTGWGMIENPGKANEARWRVGLGPRAFEDGPLRRLGGPAAVREFRALRGATRSLLAGAEIPAMAMRPGPQALLPLLRYFNTLVRLLSQGELATGTFAPYLDGPRFVVTDPWLRNWLDALAFSLSGLPASRTAAAAVAFVLHDMHRDGAALDYPRGGMGEVVSALVRGLEAGPRGSKLHLRRHVRSIDCSGDGRRISGLTLRSGRRIRAKLGVICNAPVWTLRHLIRDGRVLRKLSGGGRDDAVASSTPRSAPQTWTVTAEGSSIRASRGAASRSGDSEKRGRGVLAECDSAEQTGSFLHLHLALNATGLDLDRLEAHYTVMDRGLSGDGSIVNGVADGPCGELNMIAVSNPCALDRGLAPEGYIVVHAYGAGNEPYDAWQGMDRRSEEYRRLKADRAKVLWRAVESVIPDARQRTVLELVGSPLTHERFLRRPRGTYGSATEDYLRDGSTPFDSLVIANDGVFPGIGVPAVCIAGASAANSFVSVLRQWRCLDKLRREGKLQ